MKSLVAICLALVSASATSAAEGRDWYVCRATGKGKSGTVEKPAKDLGNIVSKLEAGDRIFLAEGVYLGRGENGHDLITVPVGTTLEQAKIVLRRIGDETSFFETTRYDREEWLKLLNWLSSRYETTGEET